VLAGATTAPWGLVQLPAASVVAMPLTASTSNSCKNSEALVPPRPVLRLALEPITTEIALLAGDPMPDLGSVVQPPAVPPLGAVGTRIGIKKVEARLLVHPVLLAARHRGLGTAVTAIVEAVAAITGTAQTRTTVAATLMAEVLLLQAPLLGTKPLRLLQLTRVLTQATVPMAPLQA